MAGTELPPVQQQVARWAVSNLGCMGVVWMVSVHCMQASTKPISREASVQTGRSPLERWLGGNTNSLALAGAELGFWNFLASSFQVRPSPSISTAWWA